MDKRKQVVMIILLLSVILIYGIKSQLKVDETFSGIVFLNYQAIPLILYGLITISICIMILLPGKIIPLKTRKILTVFTMFSMPAISYIVFETVAGNLMTNIAAGKNVIILNLACYYSIYFIIFAFCNIFHVAFICVNTFFYLWAVVNAFVVEFRGQPIMFMDFKSLGTAITVAGNYEYVINFSMALMGMLILACNLWIGKLRFHLPGWKSRISYGIIVITFTFYFFYELTWGDVLVNAGIEKLDFWAFNNSYQVNGYMLATIESFHYLKADEPDGYTVNKVKEIASTISSGKVSEQELPDNIIVIMNESFSDLSVIGEFQTSETVMPFINKLQTTAAHGNVYVSVLGGGTANSEFEFLTGNSVAYLPAGAIAYQMYVDEGDSSIVSIMKEYGYHTIAFHSYGKSNYNRVKVYEDYGFDEYFAVEDFDDVDYIRWCPSDEWNYEKLIHMVEEKKEGEKLFLFNVTMQNHGGYEDSSYINTVSLLDAPGQFPRAEQYLSLIHESDKAFEKLITYFSESNENTVILMFGDHQPLLEDDFYEFVRGTLIDENSVTTIQTQYVTPYIFWSNYGLKAEFMENIGINALGSYFLNELGMRLPTYNQYLLNMREDIPAMNANGYLDSKGVMHWIGEENDYSAGILNDYHILQYNNLFDRKNRLEEIFY